MDHSPKAAKQHNCGADHSGIQVKIHFHFLYIIVGMHHKQRKNRQQDQGI